MSSTMMFMINTSMHIVMITPTYTATNNRQ